MGKERVFYGADFNMDISEEVFSGFTDGDTWNGFACPYFTYDEATRVLEEMGAGWEYDSRKDAFNVLIPEGTEPDEYGSIMIRLDGKEIKTYAIGAYAWVWNIIEESS